MQTNAMSVVLFALLLHVAQTHTRANAQFACPLTTDGVKTDNERAHVVRSKRVASARALLLEEQHRLQVRAAATPTSRA